MRIQPTGAELLHAARAVIETSILPHLTHDRRDAARAIEQTMARAQELLARDAEPATADLAALELAHAEMRGNVLQALPAERRYDARLVAKAIAVAARELENGHAPERREYERLAALLDLPAVAFSSHGDLRCALPSLNARLAARIRRGENDIDTGAYVATLAHLEATTNEALSESNPGYRRHAARPLPSSVEETSSHAILVDGRPAPIAEYLDSWLMFGDAWGEAMFSSGSAVLSTQAGFVGWFTQRMAANPHVPMLAVESAHQAHDLSVAIADTIAALYMLALAPFRFRRAELRHAHVTRLPG